MPQVMFEAMKMFILGVISGITVACVSAFLVAIRKALKASVGR